VSLGGVQNQFSAAQQWWYGGLRAAKKGADPRDQHRKVEWLGEIIIRPEAESVDEVVTRRRGREHQHPAPAALCGQSRADLVAVEAWKVAVEDDHVVVVDEGLSEP
jgi:hypothetical protein